MGTLGDLADGEGDPVLSLLVGSVAVVAADLRYMVCIRMFLVEGSLIVEAILKTD